jgi:SAM-dependent methyltransferase
MAKDIDVPVEERLIRLLQHLGIDHAHFAAGNLDDLTNLAAKHPELFCSLTLVAPWTPDQAAITSLSSRLLVFRPDAPWYDELGELVKGLPGAILETLPAWDTWADVITRYEDEIRSSLPPFLAMHSTEDMPDANLQDGSQGAVAGITYHVQGSGPPLILMPLGLVPSQWDAIMPVLTSNYCTITLGGGKLGMAYLLEKRATSAGYLGMACMLTQEMELQPGDSVLEVGSGTGALTRWLYRFTNGKNPITGVDINQFMMKAASDITRVEGLDGSVALEVGNAEDLPYSDNQFDVTFSVTVMEEVDADKMLAEMIRVTKPGGRVGVIVRATDLPFFINLPMSDGLKEKAEMAAHGGDGGEKGCADASLYHRFQMTSLTNIKMFPHLAAFVRPWALAFFDGSVIPALNEAESAEWRAARTEAEAAGTFFFSYPHHCAVGTKPW